MFESFFPKPKLFLFTLIIWVAFVIAVYYLIGRSLAELLGFNFSPDDAETVIGLGYFITPEFLWFDLYYILSTLIFYIFWSRYSPHKWQVWSILGSSLLILMAYMTVQVSVVINAWYGPFYNDVQTALGGNGEISASDLYGHILVFCIIVFPYIIFVPFKFFFTSHYIFRWRNAMNDFYTSKWEKVRGIEGASQRVQEDTMRFSAIMQGLGVSMIDSVMTLISFLPVCNAIGCRGLFGSPEVCTYTHVRSILIFVRYLNLTPRYHLSSLKRKNVSMSREHRHSLSPDVGEPKPGYC